MFEKVAMSLAHEIMQTHANTNVKDLNLPYMYLMRKHVLLKLLPKTPSLFHNT